MSFYTNCIEIENESLRQQVRDLKKEVRALKELLANPNTPPQGGYCKETEKPKAN